MAVMLNDIKLEIIKSSVPIIWLDTSIITHMAQWKHNICRLDQTKKDRISQLYDQIYKHTRAGKLICPLAEQEAEVWVERDKWLNTIHSLSLGIETDALQAIHDIQFHIFMQAFVSDQKEIILSYKDVFDSDPVEELKETLRNPVYVTVKMPVLFGEDYQRRSKNTLLKALNEARERNVQAKVSFEEQLEAEYTGGLQALLILQRQFLSGDFLNEMERLNAVCGMINLNRQLRMWANLTGKSNNYEGLISFYRSDYYRSMPYTNLKCNLTAEAMINKQPIRSGDMMDVDHISTLMPYSNIFITDKAMSAFLKKRRLDKLYNTTVCYIGDSEVINDFFSKL